MTAEVEMVRYQVWLHQRDIAAAALAMERRDLLNTLKGWGKRSGKSNCDISGFNTDLFTSKNCVKLRKEKLIWALIKNYSMKRTKISLENYYNSK